MFYRFVDERSAKAGAGKGLRRTGRHHGALYTGADTPKKLQPKYERVAADAQN